MSLEIKLIIDTLPDMPMEGFVYNDDGYEIRDLLCEAMVRYYGEEKREWVESKFYKSNDRHKFIEQIGDSDE